MMFRIRILEASCWPYSGKRYEVWDGKRCVLTTNDLDEAHETAQRLTHGG